MADESCSLKRRFRITGVFIGNNGGPQGVTENGVSLKERRARTVLVRVLPDAYQRWSGSSGVNNKQLTMDIVIQYMKYSISR